MPLSVTRVPPSRRPCAGATAARMVAGRLVKLRLVGALPSRLRANATATAQPLDVALPHPATVVFPPATADAPGRAAAAVTLPPLAPVLRPWRRGAAPAGAPPPRLARPFTASVQCAQPPSGLAPHPKHLCAATCATQPAGEESGAPGPSASLLPQTLSARVLTLTC